MARFVPWSDARIAQRYRLAAWLANVWQPELALAPQRLSITSHCYRDMLIVE